MKQLATIGVVAIVLLGAALYFSNTKTPQPPEPVPVVTNPVPTPPPTQTGPQPVVNLAADGTLSLRTAISNGYLLQGSASDVYASIDIEAIEQQGAERPPLNVALVIDRSGSMSGDKIEHAKDAARRLVNVLGERDRVAIVSYSTDVTVDFYSQPVTDSSRVALFRAINDIAIGGGTNLSGGFQRGFSEVSKWKNAEAINRVILMSDGHANVGVTRQDRLQELSRTALGSGTSVSTLGVGLDYNEDLMTAMANLGAGNYYFVDRSEAIGPIFEQELNSLAATVARNTAVVIKLGPGVSLGELHGFDYKLSGDQIYVSLAEFAAKEKKNILIKLAASGAVEGASPIITTSMSYDDLVNDKPGHHNQALRAVVTTDASKADEMVNVDVVARVQQVEVANTMEQAVDLWSSGDAAEAQNLIKQTQTTMRKRRAKYDFKKAEKYEAADKELDSMNSAFGNVAPSSPSGQHLKKSKKARSNAIYLFEDSF